MLFLLVRLKELLLLKLYFGAPALPLLFALAPNCNFIMWLSSSISTLFSWYPSLNAAAGVGELPDKKFNDGPVVNKSITFNY
jgi:hypothetical protein